MEVNRTDDLTEALKDPTFKEWWEAREKYIEEHMTENPTMDTYIVTLKVEVEFARENDGVLTPEDAEKWLRVGDIDFMENEVDIVSVERKGGAGMSVDDPRVTAIITKVRNAVQRAEDAAKADNLESYNYWKGVAHGLNRGWDIHLGQCLTE